MAAASASSRWHFSRGNMVLCNTVSFECVFLHKIKKENTITIASCPDAAKSTQAYRPDSVFLALTSYLHSSYGASTTTQGVYKESVGSCARGRNLGER